MLKSHLPTAPAHSAVLAQILEPSSSICRLCRFIMPAVLLAFSLNAHADSSDLPYPPHPGCYEYHGCVPQHDLSWKEKKELMEEQWRRWGFPTPPAQFKYGYDGRVQSTSWAYNDGSVASTSSGPPQWAAWWQLSEALRPVLVPHQSSVAAMSNSVTRLQ